MLKRLGLWIWVACVLVFFLAPKHVVPVFNFLTICIKNGRIQDGQQACRCGEGDGSAKSTLELVKLSANDEAKTLTKRPLVKKQPLRVCVVGGNTMRLHQRHRHRSCAGATVTLNGRLVSFSSLSSCSHCFSLRILFEFSSNLSLSVLHW
ncbi:hypothetical protein HN51_025994 [Arachis hypogaea]